MRIDYARGCFSDNELEAAYVRREWRRTTSTFAVTIVILIAALTVLASLCESDATWYLPFVSTCASMLALRMALRGTVSDEVAAQKTFCRVSTALMLTFLCTTKDDPAASCKFRGGVEYDQSSPPSARQVHAARRAAADGHHEGGRTRQRHVHDLHGVVGVDRGARHYEPVRVRTYCIFVCVHIVWPGAGI